MSALAASSDPQSIATVLDTLRASGVVVLYSSELVTPDLKITQPLAGTDALARAKEALAPHGLMLREFGVNAFAVVAAPAAGDSSKTDPPLPLSDISVYASRYSLGASLNGEPHFLSGTDIADTPGSQEDALRATRVLPGFAGNGPSRPYIRGSLLDDVLVQFDGVPLVDPFHLKNFQTLFSPFDVSAVGGIEVYSGGFPVRYGSRSGGVIDIMPRTLEQGYEYAIGASLGTYNVSAVGHGDGRVVDWLATVRQSDEAVLLRPSKSEAGEPELSDSLGRVRLRAGDDAFWTVGWLLLDDQISLALDSGGESAIAGYNDEHGWLAYDRQFSDRLRSRSVLATGRSERSRAGNLNIEGIASGHLKDSRDLASYAFRSDWTYLYSPRLLWNYGLELSLANADLEYTRAASFSEPIAASFSRPANDNLDAAVESRSRTYALYAAAHRRWASVEAELGMRLDMQDYRALQTRRQVSPRLNIRYDVSDQLHAYGAWGRFSQAQRVDELRMEEGQVTPDGPELAVHTILGLAYERPGTRVGLEWYRKRWSNVSPYFDNSIDRLSLLPDLQPDRVLVAPNHSEASGIELTARHTLMPSLEAFGSYAWSQVEDEFATKDVPRSWDQPHAASVGVSWNDGMMNMSALVGWHRGWPRTPITSLTADELAISARNSDRWDNYFTLDLRAGLTIPLRGCELATWAELTNTTGRDNECCTRLGDRTPGYWPPSIFNAGFSLRFHNSR
jgi:hypothetical protein